MKKPKILLIVGIVCLLIGGYFYMGANNGDVDKQNMEIMQSGKSAEEIAQQISANNRGEVGGNSFAMFLLGFGGILTLAGGALLLKKSDAF